MFYDPAALVAFCRFNFLLRRAFIRMLHADLSAVRQAAETLDANGVKTVDCRRAGFSAAETTTQLRYYCENWKQPFHKDYTETSVTHAFEQLLALRADLEEALARGKSGRPLPAADSEKSQPDKRSTVDPSSKPVEPAAPPAAATQPSATNVPAAQQSAVTPAEKPAPAKSANAATADKTEKPATDAPAPPAGALDKEKCLESIWEQLIAEPPSRGRSMSTIVLQNTKVLLSSWEVAAFVAEGDQEAEDLRRAVVARALLAVATEERKRSGDLSQLAAALTLAKSEVSYFQGRVEQAKRAKNTEAAVNLGISTKRLLSFIEEAEKLQP
jgi:HPt (histidine-containing phosphotransfer) domain-containing protein